ncbi:TPA: DUF2971 domain-containing protein [Aeromonas veronii]|uniref:DUF2971 domain-containing protein n=1 Tax=Aeromonas veronii TaxID=654 RepID=UPI0038E56402
MSLFKFFSFNNNNLSAFSESKFWFSKVHDFNDPFEGLFIDETKSISSGQTVKLIQGMNKNGKINDFLKIPHQSMTTERLTEITVLGGLDNLREFTESTLQGCFHEFMKDLHEAGVCCFISDDNGHGIKSEPITNQLMWGYYGDGLRGFALEIHDSCSFPENDDIIKSLRVNYTRQLPVIDTCDFGYRFYTANSPQEKSQINATMMSVMTSKSELWEHENEVRFISKKGNHLISYAQESVKAIYIGEKMPEWQKTALVSLAKKNGITEIYTAFILKDQYGVSIRRLSE